MVWIHGGSFRFGAGSLDLYSGADLAKRGAIVVTINYRLGVFGTFSHPALQSASGEPDGNFGLLDQIAALRWVKQNIATFGGDAGNVTVFGESAGGVSVGYLLASPLAKGLFDKAIMESGGLAVPVHSREQADNIGLAVAKELGLGPDATAAALRALPATALRDAKTSAADVMPMRDGKVVLGSTADEVGKGHAAKVPLLIGWNNAEAGFFPPPYWQGVKKDLGTDRWEKLKPHCYGYGRDSDDACAEQVASEWFAGINSRAIALAQAAHGNPVYAYRFAWVPPAERKTARGAIHTAEIPYVFGHVAADGSADPESRKLSDTLAERWIAFARTGSPQIKDAAGVARACRHGRHVPADWR